MVEPELSITKLKMITARFQAWMTKNKLSYVDLSGKCTNKIIFRQVTSLRHIPSHFVEKLWGVNMWMFSYRPRTSLTSRTCIRVFLIPMPVTSLCCQLPAGTERIMYSFENGTLDGIASDTWRMRGRCVSLSHIPWKMRLCV
jgi:hypothetical protein